MKKYLRSVREFDRSPASFSLNFNLITNYKTYVGGCLTLLFILMGVGIFIFKVIDLFHRNQVYFSVQILKQMDEQQLNISSSRIRIALLPDYTDPQSQLKAETFTGKIKTWPYIQFDDLPLFGVEPIMQMNSLSYINNTIQQDLVNYPLIPCQDDSTAICLPQKLEKNQTLYVKGRIDFIPEDDRINQEGKQFYRRLCMILRLCDKETNPRCKQLSTPLKFYINLYNNQIRPTATQHNQTINSSPYIRSFQSHSLISQAIIHHPISFNIFFQRAIIKTDQSVLPQLIHKPQYAQTQIWYFDDEIYEDKEESAKGDLLRVYLKRSAYTQLYTRFYDRFDTMLASVFGLTNFIGIFVFGIYKGYNEWCFEQQMKRQLGIRFTSQNLCNYYLQLLTKMFYRKQSKLEQRQTETLQMKLNYMGTFNLSEEISQEVPLIRNNQSEQQLKLNNSIEDNAYTKQNQTKSKKNQDQINQSLSHPLIERKSQISNKQ